MASSDSPTPPAPATLTVLPNGGNLHFYNLSGCAGLFTAGDPATISGKLSVRPKQTITSP